MAPENGNPVVEELAAGDDGRLRRTVGRYSEIECDFIVALGGGRFPPTLRIVVGEP